MWPLMNKVYFIQENKTVSRMFICCNAAIVGKQEERLRERHTDGEKQRERDVERDTKRDRERKRKRDRHRES